MQTVELETAIQAPVETCFGLSVSIDLELQVGRGSGMQAVAGVTSGSIGFGERVTWKSKQFGIAVYHTSEITQYDPPHHFRDEMVSGIFRVFRHDHYFSRRAGRTVMRDVLRFSMPLWLLGSMSERLLARRRLLRLLRERNALVKKMAEEIP